MKKINSILLFFAVMIAFAACKKKDPDPASPESKIGNKDWVSDGVYAAGTKTFNPNLTLQFIVGSPLNSIKINNTTLSGGATWTVSSDLTSVNVTYIDPVAFIANPTTALLTGIKTQTLTISKITDTELTLKGPSATENISLLGIITLTPTSEIRFTTTGAKVSPVTDATLTRTSGWQSIGGNAFTGVFVNNVQTSSPSIVMRFSSVFGINILTVDGIPTPSTWALSDDKTKLTISTPKVNTVESSTTTFTITKLDAATGFNISTTNAATLLGLVTFSANSELRMIAN